MADFWDKYELIGEVAKGDKGDLIRIGVASKNGNDCIDVRNFYMDKTDQILPGKGITLPIKGSIDLAIEVSDLIRKAATRMAK